MSNLNNLPPELYRDIVKHLNPSELISLLKSTNNNNLNSEVLRILKNLNITSFIKKDDLKSVKNYLYWLCDNNMKLLNDIFLKGIHYKAYNIITFLLTKTIGLNVNESLNDKLIFQYFVDDHNIKLAKLLINYPQFDPNKDNILSTSPGIFAVELLKHPFINPNNDFNHDIPLIISILNNDVIKFDALMKHSKIKINKKTFGNMTPLLLLMNTMYNTNTIYMLKTLLQHRHIKVSIKNVEGENALHIAVRMNQPKQVIELLLDNPCIKINSKTYPLQLPNGRYIPGKTVLDYVNIYERNSIKKLITNYLY